MLMYELHYLKNGKEAHKYIYAYSRKEAEKKAAKYKTAKELVLVGYRGK